MQRWASAWSISARAWLKKTSPMYIALGRVLEDVWPESVRRRSRETMRGFGVVDVEVDDDPRRWRFATATNVHCVETVSVVFGPAFNAIMESSFSSDGSSADSASCAMSTGP